MFNRLELNVRGSEFDIAESRPFITFCPLYEDAYFTTVIGFENKEVTMKKFELLLRKNFLQKSFQYKG